MLNDFSVATAVVFLVQANSLCNLDDYNQIIWPYLLQYQCDLLHIWILLIIRFATPIAMYSRIFESFTKKLFKKLYEKILFTVL